MWHPSTRTDVRGHTRGLLVVPDAVGVGREMVETSPAGRDVWIRDRMDHHVQHGDPGQKDSGTDTGVRESRGLLSPLPEPHNFTCHRSLEQGPKGPSATGGTTYLDTTRY